MVRTIGEIESEADARRFSDFLYVQGISNQIEPGNPGRWDVWVHSDDDLGKAGEWLAAYRSDPKNPQFAVADHAAKLRTEKEQELTDYQKNIRTRENVFRRFVQYGMGPVTAVLIAICVGVFFWSEFGRNLGKIEGLLFSVFADEDFFRRFTASPEIRGGEIWRLVTPMLLHFGPIHIIFNMLWLRDLGGMIETIEGTGKLLALIVVSSALSNWAQYLVSGHPLFGGMSGVVYALLGYVWMKGKFQPWLGLYLHKQTVVMMLIWLVVCFTGWLGPIANWAHLGGLVVGVTWGYLGTRRA